MSEQAHSPQLVHSPCLNEDDFYSYVTGSSGSRAHDEVASHLASCSSCREELAGLLDTLHDLEAEKHNRAPISERETQETLALIQRVTQPKKRKPANLPLWNPWGAAAAAAVVVIAGGLLAYTFLTRQRAEAFYTRARAALQETHLTQSPNGLRLELPYPSGESRRSSTDRDEALNSAENLFYQALALREGMEEARLGLGFVFMNKRQYSKAQAEFQKVLEVRNKYTPAVLGRAAALYEEGLASQDAVQRSNCLESALAGFDQILEQHPDSNEALYNEALALYELGRHSEAEQEIERYLSRDPESIWSQRLHNVRLKIRSTRSEVFGKEIDRAAREHDAPALWDLANVVPYRMPPAIRSTLKRSIQMEGVPEEHKHINSAGLRYAAETMEAAYRSVTGDNSYSRLLEFYAGLSPPRRQAKRALDARFEKAIALHAKGELKAAFCATAPLIRAYLNLKDHWELVELYHLRGNCLYYDRADFNNAAIEYSKMLSSAESSGAPDLIAKSLGALSSVYNEQRAYGPGLASLLRMKALASKYRLDTWMAYSHQYLANVYERLNQLQESQREYASALALACRLGDPQVIVGTLVHLGEILREQDRFQEASKFFEQALHAHEAFSKEGRQLPFAEEVRRLNILCKQGYLALRMKNLADAEGHFKRVLESSESGMRELIARTKIGLAQVYLDCGKLEQAEEQIAASLALTESREFPELEWQARYLNGNLLNLKGDHAGAKCQYECSIAVLEGMRTGIPSRELRQAFLSQRFDPYQKMVALLFHTLGDQSKAAEYIDRSKSLTLREYLASQRDQLAPLTWEKASAVQGSFPPSLPGNFALVEYFSSHDELFVLASGRGGQTGLARKLPRGDLEQQIRMFLEYLGRGDTVSSDRLARTLHDDLIGPVLKHLESWQVDNLIVLPDGRLHLLPFGGLKDAQGRCLLEKYAISYAPSRSVLEHCLSLNRGRAGASDSVLLLDAASGLPGAAEELAHLAKLYHNRTRLAGSGDLGSLGAALNNYEIVHFSGHATIFEGKPSLVFPSSQGTAYLDGATISSWRLSKNRLVMLAGCNTGIGPLSEGETPWGLVPALLSAGAPAIISSLLPVDDRVTRRLTSRFYDLLATGSIARSRALQMAQLAILRESQGEDHGNTLSGLQFVLIGDPR